jgi:hypothetical protein
MGIFGGRAWQFVFGRQPGFRIELADEAGDVAGEPDVAVFVFLEAVRPAVRRLEGIFPDGAGLGIDPSELV